jgi:hypothetical protein
MKQKLKLESCLIRFDSSPRVAVLNGEPENKNSNEEVLPFLVRRLEQEKWASLNLLKESLPALLSHSTFGKSQISFEFCKYYIQTKIIK